jgi:hypothetical protein
MASDSKDSKGRLSRFGSVALLVVAAIMLFLAQSAYWVNHTVFDKDNFTNITTTALLSQSSRDAIATTVVNKSLENRPVIKKVVGEKAISLTSGLLGSEFASQAVTTLTSKTYAYATAPDRQDIKIDLTAIKTPIAGIVSLAQSKGVDIPQTQAQYKIPDEIVLLKSDSFPDLSGTVKAMLWLGPLFWLAAIISFSLYIYIGRSDYARRVYMAGLAVIVVAVLGLVANPFIPPPIAAAVPNIDLRPVAENLAAGFLAPFKTQMYYMLGIVLVVLLAFNQRFNLLAIINSLGSKLSGPPHKPQKKKS